MSPTSKSRTGRTKKRKRPLGQKKVSVSLVSKPDIEDVLLGRGPGKARHNELSTWKKLIYKSRPEYTDATCSRSSKKEISLKIVQEVTGLGGRFLEERSDGEWEVVPEKLALTKTKQALRDGSRLDAKQEAKEVENNLQSHMDFCAESCIESTSGENDQDLTGDGKLLENLKQSINSDSLFVYNYWNNTQPPCLLLGGKDKVTLDTPEGNILGSSSLSNFDTFTKDCSAGRNINFSFSTHRPQRTHEHKEEMKSSYEHISPLMCETGGARGEEENVVTNHVTFEANSREPIPSTTSNFEDTMDSAHERKENVKSPEESRLLPKPISERKKCGQDYIQAEDSHLISEENAEERLKRTTLDSLDTIDNSAVYPIQKEEFAIWKNFHTQILALADITSKLKQEQQTLRSAIETMDTDLQTVANSQNETASQLKIYQSVCADQACENIAYEMEIEELEQTGGSFKDCASLAQNSV